MNKRSQITIYILLAIVIVGSLIFLILPRQKPSAEYDDLNKWAELISKSDSVKFYVESCLEQATKDAVGLVGVQGGYIYETQVSDTLTFFGQGGKLCDILPTECVYSKNLIPYQTRIPNVDNVSYGIKSPATGYLPLDYPYRGSLRSTDKVNTYGTITGGEKEGSFIELCYLNGANDVKITGAEYSCFDSYSTTGSSIQYFLERYIENKTLKCADFRNLSTLSGIQVEPKNITARVLIGDNDLIVSIKYELQLRLTDSTPSARQSLRTMADFSYTMNNMRLKQVYQLAYYLLQGETSSLFFDVTSEKSLKNLMRCTNLQDPSANTKCLKSGMEVKLIRDPCPNCENSPHSDILQIIDSNSEIDSLPYIFQVGIANRPPALDFIDKDIQPDSLYYTYLAQTLPNPNIYRKRTLTNPSLGANQNLIVGVGDELEIYPYAFDPDETPVSYTYQHLGTDNLGDRLSISPLFQATHSAASVPLTTADIGEHKFRIVVVDNEGGSDQQDVKVLVCDTSPDCAACPTCNYCCT